MNGNKKSVGQNWHSCEGWKRRGCCGSNWASWLPPVPSEVKLENRGMKQGAEFQSALVQVVCVCVCTNKTVRFQPYSRFLTFPCCVHVWEIQVKKVKKGSTSSIWRVTSSLIPAFLLFVLLNIHPDHSLAHSISALSQLSYVFGLWLAARRVHLGTTVTVGNFLKRLSSQEVLYLLYYAELLFYSNLATQRPARSSGNTWITSPPVKAQTVERPLLDFLLSFLKIYRASKWNPYI